MIYRLLYGGTFDPVHHGHLIPCRRACEMLDADNVLLIPAGISPHKTARESATAQQRLDMLHLAVENERGFSVDPRELSRPGPSFTIDTLRELVNEPGETFTLLIGADQLPLFATWRDVSGILALVSVGVLARPGIDMQAGLEAVYGKLGELARKRVLPLDTPLIDISATSIRQRVADGQSIRYLVPDAVADYITQHHLYQTASPGSPIATNS